MATAAWTRCRPRTAQAPSLNYAPGYPAARQCIENCRAEGFVAKKPTKLASAVPLSKINNLGPAPHSSFIIQASCNTVDLGFQGDRPTSLIRAGYPTGPTGDQRKSTVLRLAGKNHCFAEKFLLCSLR